MQAMQQTHGNHAVQRFIQRSKAQQAVQVQRWGLADIWDSVKKGGSAIGDVGQNETPPTSGKEPVGPVVMPDNLPVPMTRVGPVVMPDNLPVPGMSEQWPDSDSWV